MVIDHLLTADDRSTNHGKTSFEQCQKGPPWLFGVYRCFILPTHMGVYFTSHAILDFYEPTRISWKCIQKKIGGSFKEHYFLSWRLRPNRGGNDKTTGTKFFLLKSRRFKGYTFFFQLMKLKIRKDEDIAGAHVFP